MAHISSDLCQTQTDSIKRHSIDDPQSQRPSKKIKLLVDEDDTSDQDGSTASETGRATTRSEGKPNGHEFSVNEDFARRFEYNKKREELHRLQDKYGETSANSNSRHGPGSDDIDAGGSDLSTESEEDDEGILASEALDAQIQTTIEAIRKKDPRVYDGKINFYTDLDDKVHNSLGGNTKKEKPMFLSDYHRRNLLEGELPEVFAEREPESYAQQQDSLKNDLVKEMHAAAVSDKSAEDHLSNDGESDGGFLIRKPPILQDSTHAEQAGKQKPEVDIESAERDPETYLSNFMSARAWVPSDGARFQPFESDDEEEERQADLFEEAYNLRFEDPSASNEKLLSHARDAAAKYSVRKEAMNPRKKAREAERSKNEAAKQIREDEKARLRKLKVVEAEEKIRKIKEAAGLKSKSLEQEDWSTFLDEGWDDTRWEQEMKRRFGDDYYAASDAHVDDGKGDRKQKIKKPKWDDNISINDLIPEFDAEESAKPQFELTEDEFDGGGVQLEDPMGRESKNRDSNLYSAKNKSNRKRHKHEDKAIARQERRKIELLVDQHMSVDETMSSFSKKHAGQFRYRETSPTAFGLTAQDILLASDSQLNQYAGLKKMAAFRDSDKKRKDKKHLGKKARLRQWRKDTFGNEQGPQKTLTELLAGQDVTENVLRSQTDNGFEVKDGKRKTRSKKRKSMEN